MSGHCPVITTHLTNVRTLSGLANLIHMQSHLKITGHVQGVFYRAHARNEAEKLNLKGIIRNMPDGSVEAILQGAQQDLEAFKTWAIKGSPSSKPDHVEMTAGKQEETFNTVEIY